MRLWGHGHMWLRERSPPAAAGFPSGPPVPPEAIEIIAFAAVALVLVLVVAPATASRRTLAVRGSAGLGGTVAIAAAPTFELVLLVLLALGVLQAAVAGNRPFACPLSAPGLRVAWLSLAPVP